MPNGHTITTPLANMKHKGAPIPLVYRILALFLVLVFVVWMIMVY